MKPIYLTEILYKSTGIVPGDNTVYTTDMVLKAMKDTAELILSIAAEKAKGVIVYDTEIYVKVEKESIIDIINRVE